MMIVPDAANMSPAPWQTEISAPGSGPERCRASGARAALCRWRYCEVLDHLYRLGQNRGHAEEIGSAFFQLGKFVEPFRGFFFGHILPAHDRRSDYSRDPIACACGIVGSVQYRDRDLPEWLHPNL